mgnify:CR=1 FL=1
MAQSDITIDALSKVGQQDAEYLVSLVRSVPGFPKEGIIFRDFMPVLADPKGLKILLKALEEALPVSPSEFDSIAGLESRGFLFGPAMAGETGSSEMYLGHAGERRILFCRLKPSVNPMPSNTARPVSKSKPTPYRQGSECSSSMTSSPRAAPPKPPPTLSKRPVAPWWASVS